MWHLFKQQSASVIVDALKTKLLPLAPPDHNTNAQACLAVTQTTSGTKSEEIKEIDRAYMAPGEVKAFRTTDPMVILRANGRSLRTPLILAASYDTVQQSSILPIQEMKADEMEMSKRIMARIPNMDGEEEGSRMNTESSSGIYFTASVESQYRLIPLKQKMKEEDNIKNTMLNALKSSARMNQSAKLFAKLGNNFPNDMMVS